MIKRNKLVLFFFAACLLILAGCGQKGPLYLPDQEQEQTNQAEQSDSEQTEEEKK